MELTIEKALQQGVTAHKEGKLQDAERFYRSILQAQPAHPDASHNLGLIAVSVNKSDAALPLLKTALEANPGVEQFWLSYIDALIKEKQFENAKQVIQQGKQQGVDGGRLKSLESQLASISETESIRSVSPSQEQLSKLLEHFQNGRYDDAEKLALILSTQCPRHNFSWKILGAVLKKTDRASEAVFAGERTIEIAPGDAEAHFSLGNTLQELGRFDEAEARYNQAIALIPGYAEAHNNLGFTLQELGRLEEAEESYAKAIALNPDFVEAHSNLGNTLQELGRLDEAEASYTRAISLKPNFAEALHNRGYLLFYSGKFEAAIRDADACSLKKTRILPLVSLYALGRIGEIYERIEIQFKEGGEDLNVAAFSAFIFSIEKKPTAYNFCPNPLDFVHVANLSSHVADSAAYVAGVVGELNKIETMWEPFGKTTVNGFQSLNGMNLFQSPAGRIAQLKSIIIAEIEAYYLKFKNEQCSYMQKFPNIRNLFGWTVILKQQGHQKAHIHSSGWLSGVVYLKVVPAIGKDEGAIQFSLNSKDYHDMNAPSLTFQPEVGDMIFFPSSLHHKTIPFTTDVDRIIVSFDLVPEEAKR